MTNYTDGQIRLAIDYSHNYATARPDTPEIVKEHIFGLCERLESLLAERQAAKAGVVTDADVEKACRAICASRGFDPDERCTYPGGKLVRGKNGEFYPYWTTYEVDARTILESAALASVWPTAGGGVMNDPVLIVEYNAAVDAEIRDAKRWRCFVKGLRSRFAGAAHGKRIKIVEICPMYGDEGNSVDNIVEFVDAAIAAAEGEKK